MGLMTCHTDDCKAPAEEGHHHCRWCLGAAVWPGDERSSVELQPMEGEACGGRKLRYLDHEGRDWIDECAEMLTPEQFRGAMIFTIGKYLRRFGKKDELHKEADKIADYGRRWAEYEKRRTDH